MTRIVEIVKQLRQGSLNNDDYRWKAADEIEQNRIDLEEYRRDVERLRAALGVIVDAVTIPEANIAIPVAIKEARAALDGK